MTALALDRMEFFKMGGPYKNLWNKAKATLRGVDIVFSLFRDSRMKINKLFDWWH